MISRRKKTKTVSIDPRTDAIRRVNAHLNAAKKALAAINATRRSLSVEYGNLILAPIQPIRNAESSLAIAAGCAMEVVTELTALRTQYDLQDVAKS